MTTSLLSPAFQRYRLPNSETGTSIHSKTWAACPFHYGNARKRELWRDLSKSASKPACSSSVVRQANPFTNFSRCNRNLDWHDFRNLHLAISF